MLTLESKFSEFVDICIKAGACKEAVAWMDKELAKDKGATFGSAMKNFVSDSNALESWAIWNINKLSDQFSQDVIDGFIDKIKDPKSAFDLYVECAKLATTSDSKLESVFIVDGKHLLPTCQKELQTGIVSKASVEVAHG